jgi:hypothetical protein
VVPTHYSLRHFSSSDTDALRNWVLEGSNDSLTWNTIKEHANDKTLQSAGQWGVWALGDDLDPEGYSYLRIRQTGLNSGSHGHLALSGIKLYGALRVPDDFPLFYTGSVKISLSPSGEVLDAGRWSLDGGGSWHQSGDTLNDLLTGEYTVSVNSLTGYWPPDNLQIWVITNELKKYTLTYTAMDNKTDADRDGIPDLWESQQGLDPLNRKDAAADFDRDGMSSFYEYALGGNPRKRGDRIDPILTRSGSNLYYIHKRRSDSVGLVYTVEMRTNLTSGTWVNAAPCIQGVSSNAGSVYMDVTNSILCEQPQTFIRLKIQNQ